MKKKLISLISAVTILTACINVIPVNASYTKDFAPVSEMGVRIAPESAAGNVASGNLGAGIAKKNESDAWESITTVGEGTDGRVSNRYDLTNSTTTEVGYGQGKRFALIDEYSIENLAEATELTFKYTSASTSNQYLAMWIYDGAMPTSCSVNATGKEDCNTIIQTLARAYGIYSGNNTTTDATIGTEAIAPLAKSSNRAASGSVYTITVNGDALETLKQNAVYDDAGNGTVVLTINGDNLVAGTTNKIYLKSSTVENTAPSVTASYEAKEVSDTPEGSIELKNAANTASVASKQFVIDDASYITAPSSTNNTSIWYLGSYNIEDVSSVKVKTIMCPNGDLSIIPTLKIAYMDKADDINSDYLAANSGTIRSAASLIGSLQKYTTTQTNSDLYSDFSTETIDISTSVTGEKDLFLYTTADKTRVFLDYVTVNSLSYADYPANAQGVYNTDVITNYTGEFVKSSISDTEYRYIANYNNNNGMIWYLGSYNKNLISDIDVSAAMTAALGTDDVLYNPSVKIGYMPKSTAAVDADYINTNSGVIRSSANKLAEISKSTDGVVTLNNIPSSEFNAISDEWVELFVYGTTQVADANKVNAKPTLGLDYVAVNVNAPETLSITASDDMMLRTSNTNDYRKTSTIELKASASDRYAFTGAVKFDISQLKQYIANGYKVKSVALRTTTMKRNNNRDVMAVPFTTDFGEDYAKNDILADELVTTEKYVVDNFTSYNMGAVNYALTGKKLNEYATVEDADSDLSKWYNTVDITAYAAGAAKSGASALPILLYNADANDISGNILCTKDIESDSNWDTISAFYTINGNAVTAADFAPTLIVDFESGEETAEPVDVMTDRYHTNRMIVSGGYDYLAWVCDTDITYNGVVKTAGSDIYSLSAALEQNPEISQEHYTLTTFYVTGADMQISNGAVNTKTNPYVVADGTSIQAPVTEFVNKLTLSDDLVSENNKVYIASYNADGTLNAIAAYDAASVIEIPTDANGEGFAIANGNTFKAFVWNNIQKAVYTN